MGSGRTTTLSLELARTNEALGALAPEWGALWRRVSETTPFQSPAWLLPWWGQFGTGQPRVAVLRAGNGGLLGLLPLYVLDEAPKRKLLLIGAGTTDYLDVLLAPEAPPGAVELLLDAALADAPRDGVTACDLTDLPPGSMLRDAATRRDWREESRWSDPCPVLAMHSGATRLEEVIPRGKLRDLRLAHNRAARAGGWKIEIAAPNSLDRLLGELERLHQERWIAAGEPGVFADLRVGAFHRAAAPGLLKSGLLRLSALLFGERVVAVYYTLLAGQDRLLLYLPAFDLAHARESPGTILIGAILEEAMREGRSELHFLRGAEAYKYDWGAVDRMNTGRRLAPIGDECG
jgi:CelD/BcsL family acetyltransferase involved in cellulose biosynthesis